jgi:hypothetical protein
VIDVAVTELEPFTSVKRACELLGKSRATLHRQRNPEPAAEKAPPGPRAPHPAALSGAEQAALLAVLDSERFADKSRPRCMPSCSTTASTWPPSAPCTG